MSRQRTDAPAKLSATCGYVGGTTAPRRGPLMNAFIRLASLSLLPLMLENRSLDNLLGWLYADQENRPAHNVPMPTDGRP